MSERVLGCSYSLHVAVALTFTEFGVAQELKKLSCASTELSDTNAGNHLQHGCNARMSQIMEASATTFAQDQTSTRLSRRDAVSMRANDPDVWPGTANAWHRGSDTKHASGNETATEATGGSGSKR